MIVASAIIGIYVAFQMIVVGALSARLRGWVPGGKFRLGAWAWPVNIVALIYGAGAIVDMAWPRTPNGWVIPIVTPRSPCSHPCLRVPPRLWARNW